MNPSAARLRRRTVEARRADANGEAVVHYGIGGWTARIVVGAMAIAAVVFAAPLAYWREHFDSDRR